MNHPAPDAQQLADEIVELLGRRAPGATICPSEVARQHADGQHPDGWRELMPQVRAAAAVLADGQVVQATRGGQAVHPQQEGGPIRLGRGPRFQSHHSEGDRHDGP